MPPSSSTLIFFLLLLLSPPIPISATSPPPLAAPPINRTPENQAEIEALTAFRLAVQDPLSALSGWNSSSPSAPCSWRGVTCASFRIVELRLPRLRLSGPLSSSLSAIPLLRKLSLHIQLFPPSKSFP